MAPTLTAISPASAREAEVSFREVPVRTAPATRRPGRPWESRVKLTIVMPAYNEERTIARAVQQILDLNLSSPLELLVVDDGSSDRTQEILAEFWDPRLRVHSHAVNSGKGAAVLTGIANASGSHLLVFDADLEYSAEDISRVLAPIVSGQANVVYGVRNFDRTEGRQPLRFRIGNRVMTITANLLYGTRISDLHTCLKLAPVSALRQLDLTEEGFGLDTEITAKLLQNGIKPCEVPISYKPRSRAEGKKIDWRDGVKCLQILFRVRAQSVRRPSATEIDLTTPVRVEVATA